MTQTSRTSTKHSVSEERFLGLAISLGMLVTFMALALYGYLGTFSRYGSDDYCLSAFFAQDDLSSAFIQRYFTASSRYTNILFIGLVDRLFGWYNVAILPALMLILFVLGSYLFLKEIAEMLRLGWSRWMLLFLALSVVFFSITQAPDLYEILFWRAGMTSHLTPLVFIPFLGAFLLKQVKKANERLPSFWIQAASFTIPLVIGGFSEPPTALMITVLGLAILAAWQWGDPRNRRSILVLLLWSLLGALTALVVMALAPANSIRMQTPPPPPLELISKTIYYPSFFIVDTLRTLPTPTAVSIAVSVILFYAIYLHSSQPLSKEARNRLIILMLLVLVFAYLLIAASFAPSVYGQSYPVPRARFAARVVMTVALMMEGALLGTLAAQVRTRSFQTIYLRQFALLAFMILALYPLRTAWRALGEVPAYQQRAAAWDLRDAEIRRLKAEGVQDLVVGFLSDEETQDLGDYTEYRLNRCAAVLYGVNSIVAVPVK